MSEITTPGTKGFVHFPAASYLSHTYRPVTVMRAHDGMIWVAPDTPGQDIHAVYETTRTLVAAPNQRLILEDDPLYEKAAKRWEYDALVANTAATVRKWSYDETNPGLALQASEALRLLASTPEPPKD